MSRSAWWRGLPGWLKVVYLLVAVPAWLFIIYSGLTNQNKSPAAFVAAALFGGVVLLLMVFDRRKGGAGHDAGAGYEVGVGEGGGD